MDGWMVGCMHAYMYTWMDWVINEWVDGWMCRYIVAHMYVWTR